MAHIKKTAIILKPQGKRTFQAVGVSDGDGSVKVHSFQHIKFQPVGARSLFCMANSLQTKSYFITR